MLISHKTIIAIVFFAIITSYNLSKCDCCYKWFQKNKKNSGNKSHEYYCYNKNKNPAKVECIKLNLDTIEEVYSEEEDDI